jgi:HD-like signal output (HDOD) protein
MTTLTIRTADVTEIKEKALRYLNQLPPFSPVLTRLLAMLGRMDVSFREMASVIEKDTILAGNVLKLVNSGMYGRRATVTSVPHALTLLGQDRLRNAALGLSVTRLWQKLRFAKGFSLSKFNQHSLAVAILSDQIALRAKVQFPEGAFAAGLFHDLGKVLMASGLPDEYEAVERILLAAEDRGFECRRRIELEVMGITQAELSAAALERWNLPAEVVEAVREHRASGDLPEGEASPLWAVVGVADLLATQLGAGMHDFDEVSEEPELSYVDRLGVQNSQDVVAQFQTEFQSLQLVA